MKRLALTLLLLAGLTGPALATRPQPAATDYDDLERPRAIPFGVAPGSISVSWEHSGSGVAYFTVVREYPSWSWGNVNAAQRTVFDSGLQPSTSYRYYVCAWFISYDGAYACSDWASATTLPPPPPSGGSASGNGGTGGGAGPALPAAVAMPVLRAQRSGVQVNLSWDLPPSLSVVLTHGRLYRNGRVIYEALHEGNYDSDHTDVVQPNRTNRYKFCFEGPAFGERCSAEVAVQGPIEVAVPFTPGAAAAQRSEPLPPGVKPYTPGAATTVHSAPTPVPVASPFRPGVGTTITLP